ncbi:SRPBCC domain-containing protein [Pedobacter miscanthi]|jgi:uncharacterized protein YndB with AHSA1/START domain|uniref:SRPBCC family protein n=1 Tax=Pedobacter miscanthi TaxID=2259170 RepID=UPI00292F53A5|nr:SRPBCC domain-containing protein [Pedobacter miscanthi]
MENEPVIVERLYNAPIEKVWKALTDNNEIKQWYFQLADFKPEVGFKFEFTGGADDGPQYLHLCEITEVIAGKKIAYTWRYDGLPGNSEVSWELFEQGDKTLLKLTHTGLESFASNGPDFAKTSFNGGWNYFVNDALKKYLEPEG